MGINKLGEQIRPERLPKPGQDGPQVPSWGADTILRVMRKGFELGRNLEDVSQKDPSSHAERKSPPYTETLAG